MKIAVLGTGMVGNAIATKLVQVGHEIIMGSRNANSDAGLGLKGLSATAGNDHPRIILVLARMATIAKGLLLVDGQALQL